MQTEKGRFPYPVDEKIVTPETEREARARSLLFYSTAVMALSVIIAGCFYYFLGKTYREFTREDGAIEYLTFLFYALAGFFFLVARRYYPGKAHQIQFLAVAILCIFVACEEISWGERILDYEGFSSIKENNSQDETNLHNIPFFEYISFAFMGAIVVICIVFPILEKKSLSKFLAKYPLIIPPQHLVPFFLLAALLFLNAEWGILSAQDLVSGSQELSEFLFGYAFLSLALYYRYKGGAPGNDAPASSERRADDSGKKVKESPDEPGESDEDYIPIKQAYDNMITNPGKEYNAHGNMQPAPGLHNPLPCASEKIFLSITVLYIILICIFVVTASLSHEAIGELTQEAGILENLQAIFYFISAAIFLYLFKTKLPVEEYPSRGKYVLLGFSILFLLVACEEISWGQRVIGFDTPHMIEENNYQDETTFHNLGNDWEGAFFIYIQSLSRPLFSSSVSFYPF